MSKIDKTKPYIKYALDVISGKIVAGKWIKLACQRYIDWFDRDDMYFDYDDIEKKTKFINSMKHYQGSFAGKPFILMPWESWVLSNLWCWKWKDDGTNVINKALISMSRKNAKTALCSAISLCHVIFDERGAEVDFLANSSQQASIALDHTLHFAKSLDPKEKVFKRYRNQIRIPKTDSVIMIQSSDSTTKDGFNSSLFIQDEFGAAQNWDLYNVFLSSMGMRKNPLAIVISTAGFLLSSYPMYEYCESCKRILEGTNEDDSQFVAMYFLDEEDDWKNEDNWVKCNPSLGETVTVKYLRDQKKMAENQPGTEVSTRTKNFNTFCQSSEVWIADDRIANCMKEINLDDFEQENCYIGVDLSSVSDVTATAVLFPPNPDRNVYPDKYVFKSFLYLPEETIQSHTNSKLYTRWKRNKSLIHTEGNVIDYSRILDDQIAINERCNVQEIAFDSWNATQWALSAQNAGLPLAEYSQSLGNFNKPCKEFERLALSDKVIIDSNEMIRWMFGNVDLRIDANGNAKPQKGKDRNKKIDGVIAMLEALGSYLDNTGGDASIS